MRGRWLGLIVVAVLAGLACAGALAHWLPAVPLAAVEFPTQREHVYLVRTLDEDRVAVLTPLANDQRRLDLFRFDGAATLQLVNSLTIDLTAEYRRTFPHSAVLLNGGKQFFLSFHGLIMVKEVATGRTLFESRPAGNTFEEGNLDHEDPSRIWVSIREYAGPPPKDKQAYRKTVRSRKEAIRWEPTITREVVYESLGSAFATPIQGNRLLCSFSENDDQQGSLRVVDRATGKVVKEWKDIGRPSMEFNRDYVVVRTPRQKDKTVQWSELIIDLQTLETLPARPSTGWGGRPGNAQHAIKDPTTGQDRYFDTRTETREYKWFVANAWLRRLTGWPQHPFREQTEIVEWQAGVDQPRVVAAMVGSRGGSRCTGAGLLWLVTHDFPTQTARLVCWNLLAPSRPWTIIMGGGVAVALLTWLVGWFFLRRTASPIPSTPTAVPGPSP